MQCSRYLPTVALGSLLLTGGSAFAALLGIAGLLGFPSLVFNSTGFTAYEETTETFQVQASPLAIVFTPGDPPRFVDPVGGVEAVALHIRVGPGGTLVSGNPFGHDLLVFGEVDATGNGVIDYSGELLTGEILAFGFENTGGTTDFFDFRFALTGGEMSSLFVNQDIGMTLTVENSTFTGSFTTDFGGNAKGVIGPIPMLEEPGNEGCSQGFWKQPHHWDHWVGYDPDHLFCDVFDCSTTDSIVVYGGKTLVEVLNQGGGQLRALGRQAVAALLNAASSVAYPLSEADVIQMVNDAIASDDKDTIDGLKDQLDAFNNLGCPEFHMADLNGDAWVDVFDLLELINNWGGSANGDLNGDGVVDVFDLLIMINNWGYKPAEWTPSPILSDSLKKGSPPSKAPGGPRGVK